MYGKIAQLRLPLVYASIGQNRGARGLIYGIVIITCDDYMYYRPTNDTWNEQESWDFVRKVHTCTCIRRVHVHNYMDLLEESIKLRPMIAWVFMAISIHPPAIT